MDKKTQPPATKPQPGKPQVPNTEQSKSEHKENQQYLIIMAIVSSLIVIAGGVLVFNLFKSFLHKTNEVKAQDIYINALKQKKTDLATLQQNFDEIKSKGIDKKVYNALPTRAEFKTILGVIENIGNKSGVVATVTSQGATASSSSGATTVAKGNALSDDEQKGSSPLAYTVNVQVEAPYDQILTFMQNCVTNLRFLNFRSISISSSKDSTITATLTFETYYQGVADISNKTESLTDYLKAQGGK